MAFESMHAFWSMGGYAFYVWLSFGIAVAVMGANIITARWAYRDMLLRLKTFYANEADNAKDITTP